MPLTFDSTGSLKRLRGRPSAADREFERRLRAAAEAELRADLDPALETDERYFPGTQRHRKEPPALTGRSAKFIAMVAAGASEEDARVACKLQKRALRRLLTMSPLFRAALEGARAAVKAQCVEAKALGASSTVMTKQIDLRRDEAVTADASVTSDDDEAAPPSVKANIINRDHPPEAK